MWCVLCRTAFDWVSGRKIDPTRERVFFHNPHLFDYLREQRQPTQQASSAALAFGGGARAVAPVGDDDRFGPNYTPVDGCNVPPSVFDLADYLRGLRGTATVEDKKNAVTTHLRRLGHMHVELEAGFEIEYPSLSPIEERRFMANLDIRYQLLTKVYDEARFEKVLHGRHRTSLQAKQVWDVCRLVVGIGSEILHRLLATPQHRADLHAVKTELDELFTYARGRVNSIREHFGKKQLLKKRLAEDVSRCLG